MLLTKLATWTLKGNQLLAAAIILIWIIFGLTIYAYTKGYTEGYTAAEDELEIPMFLSQTKAIASALEAQKAHYEKQLSIMEDKHEREMEIERQKNTKDEFADLDIECFEVEREDNVHYEREDNLIEPLLPPIQTVSN